MKEEKETAKIQKVTEHLHKEVHRRGGERGNIEGMSGWREEGREEMDDNP